MPLKDPRSIFDHAPDGMLVVDRQGMIRDANPQAGVLFGCAVPDLIDSPIDRLVPQASRSGHAAHRDRYMKNPVSRPMGIGMQLTAQRLDGTTFPVEISLGHWESDGDPIILVTIRDITLRKRLRDFGASALRAAEEVRAEIARDLHDDTAQQLSAHLIRLRLMEKAETPAEKAEHLAALREGLQQTAEDVRRVARGLRPPELEDAGLSAALWAHARYLEDARNLKVELNVEPLDDYLTADERLVLYRVIQEALTNVARHSGTSRAEVEIVLTERAVVATVSDAGRGFAAARQLAHGTGLGLIGMQERAAMVGGRLSVTSAPDEGTTVTIAIPVAGSQGTGQDGPSMHSVVHKEVGGV